MSHLLNTLNQKGKWNKRARPLNSIYCELNSIASHSDFIYTIVNIINTDYIGDISVIYTRNVYDRLSLKEVQFLMGLLVKNSSDISINAPSWQKIYKQTIYIRNLLEELHEAVNTDMSVIFNNLSVSELLFYSSESAYCKQYIDFTSQKYINDKNWLSENKKVDIDQASTFFYRLKSLLENKINKLNASYRNTPKDYLNAMCFTSDEIKFNFKEFDSFIQLFSVPLSNNNEHLNSIGDYNILQEKPIVKLDENRYFVPFIYNIAEAIYTSPYYWMIKDDQYKNKANKHRGISAEEISYNLIRKIFPVNNIFKNVYINESKKKRVTEIDILAIEGQTAIIFQVKSKGLTQLSKKGNYENIKDDYTKAVEAAYRQGMKCKKCILNAGNYSFDGCNLEDINNVSEVYIVTILLEGFPGLLTLGKVLFSDKTSANQHLAINIFSLDLLIEILETSKKFTDYVRERDKYSDILFADNEITILFEYLNNGFNDIQANYLNLADNRHSQNFEMRYHEKEEKRIRQSKINKNAFCPCGSGLKYKECHGQINAFMKIRIFIKALWLISLRIILNNK